MLLIDHKPLVGIFKEDRAISSTATNGIQQWTLPLTTKLNMDLDAKTNADATFSYKKERPSKRFGRRTAVGWTTSRLDDCGCYVVSAQKYHSGRMALETATQGPPVYWSWRNRLNLWRMKDDHLQKSPRSHVAGTTCHALDNDEGGQRCWCHR